MPSPKMYDLACKQCWNQHLLLANYYAIERSLRLTLVMRMQCVCFDLAVLELSFRETGANNNAAFIKELHTGVGGGLLSTFLDLREFSSRSCLMRSSSSTVSCVILRSFSTLRRANLLAGLR